MISFSKQSRSSWYFVIALLVVMALLQFAGTSELRYQRNWLESREWWRLLTAHWIHFNWVHYCLNSAGLLLCMSITAPHWKVPRWLVYQLILSLGISLLFSHLNPELDWYVGYSGVLYGIFMLAAFDLYPRDKIIAVLLAAAIVIKITIEQSGELNLTTSDIIGTPVVVDAHLYGVLLAITIILVNRLISIVLVDKPGGNK